MGYNKRSTKTINHSLPRRLINDNKNLYPIIAHIGAAAKNIFGESWKYHLMVGSIILMVGSII